MNKEKEEVIFIIAAVISLICSLSVALTYMMFFHRRFFMQIILMISISDILASIGSSLGLPPDNSPLCPIQAFMVVVFYKSSWCWCSILTYQLYCVVVYTKVYLTWPVMHFIGWFIPLLTTLLPLTTNKFGRDDIEDEDIMGWCYYKGNAEYWDIITFDLLLLSTLICMAFFTIRVYNKMSDFSDNIYGLISALAYYPLSIAISWSPTLILAFLINSSIIPLNNTVRLLYFICTLLSTQNGTLLAIIFFGKSPEARIKWYNFIWKKDLILSSSSLLKFDNINNDHNDDDNDQRSDTSFNSIDSVLYRFSHVGNFNNMLLPFNEQESLINIHSSSNTNEKLEIN